MPTRRLYLASSGSPSVTPALDDTWDFTAGALQSVLSTTKGASGMTDRTVTLDLGPGNYILGQFVSPPLALLKPAVAAFFGGVIRAKRTGTGTPIVRAVFRIFDSTGGTERARIYSTNATRVGASIYPTVPLTIPSAIRDPYSWDATVNSTEWQNRPIRDNYVRVFPDGYQAEFDPPVPTDQMVLLEQNDRIVLELGILMSGGTGSVVFELGEAAADLSVANHGANSTSGAPWIELVDAHNPFGNELSARYRRPYAPRRDHLRIQSPGIEREDSAALGEAALNDQFLNG